MKKQICLALCLFGLSATPKAQLMVSKLLGSENARYGLGYGLFTFLDFPLSSGNQSVRLELAEFVFYPSKGEPFFTSTEPGRGYLSVKLGYKYVFSEDQNGFYLLPSAGYCRVVNAGGGQETTYGDGFAAATEAGYSLGIGEKGHSVNFGLKLETNRAGATHNITTLGFRVGYAFNLFHPQ